MLGVRLKNKLDPSKTMIVSCAYLLPESLKYGKNNKNVLNNLTIEMY